MVLRNLEVVALAEAVGYMQAVAAHVVAVPDCKLVALVVALVLDRLVVVVVATAVGRHLQIQTQLT